MKNCFKMVMLFCVFLVTVITTLLCLGFYPAAGFLSVVLFFSFIFAPLIVEMIKSS